MISAVYRKQTGEALESMGKSKGFRGEAYSDKGYRKINEDQYKIWEPDDAAQCKKKGTLYIVADGMGGHQAGEVASHLAVSTIVERYYSDEYSSLNIEESLVKAVEEANRAIYEEAQKDPARAGMGTTVVAAVIKGKNELYVAHVGDSRAYLIQGDRKIERITKDHSWVEREIEAGRLTRTEAETHPRRHQITRSLGKRPKVKVDVKRKRISASDVVVLCSDGLTDWVPEKEIETVVRSNPPEWAAKLLVALANQYAKKDAEKRAKERAISSDNVTTIVIGGPKAGATAPARGKSLAGLAVAALFVLTLVLGVRIYFRYQRPSPPLTFQPVVIVSTLSQTRGSSTAHPPLTDTPAPQPQIPTSTVAPTMTLTPTQVLTPTEPLPVPATVMPTDASAGVRISPAAEVIGDRKVVAVAVASTDSHIIYAAVQGDGVYKSTDAGASWDLILQKPSVAEVALDPTHADVVYVGTRGGIQKSADGGQNWTILGKEQGLPKDRLVEKIVVASSDAQRLYAVAGGIYISYDGGNSWSYAPQNLPAPTLFALTVDPSDKDIIYVGTGSLNNEGGPFMSGDAGASWRLMGMTEGLKAELGIDRNPNCYALAVSPYDSQILYASLSGVIFKSTDRGGSWTRLPAGQDLFRISIAPSDPQVIFAGGRNIVKSTDAGETWEEVASATLLLRGEEVLPPGEENYAFIRDMVFDESNAQVLYVATARGLLKTEDGGVTWKWCDSWANHD